MKTSSQLSLLALGGVAILGAAVAQEGTPPARILAPFLPRAEIGALVLDRQGRPVTDLDPAEFRVSLAGLPVEGLERLNAPGPAPRSKSGGQTFIVLVDHQLLPPGRLTGLVEALAGLVSARAERGDRVLLAAFDGRLELVAPLAEGGATAVVKLAELSGRRASALALEIDRRWRRRNTEELEPAAVALGERASLDDALRRASRASLDGLDSLLQAVGDLTGPKSLLFVTGGLPYADERSTSGPARSFSVRIVGGAETEIPGAAQDSPSVRYLVSQPPLPSGQGRSAPPRFAALLATAGRAQVTFFPWVVEPPVAGLRGGLAGALERRALFEPHLAELARASGGELLRADQPRASTERLATLLDGTYRLRFAAPAAVNGDRPPPVQVAVARPRLEVRHGAVATPSEAGPSPAARALATLWRGDGENPLQLAAAARQASARGDGRLAVPVDFRLPCDRVRFAATPRGGEGRLTLAVAVKEADGRVSPVEHLALRATRPALAAADPAVCRLSYTAELVLAAGSEAVAVAVADELSGEISALRLSLR